MKVIGAMAPGLRAIRRQGRTAGEYSRRAFRDPHQRTSSRGSVAQDLASATCAQSRPAVLTGTPTARAD